MPLLTPNVPKGLIDLMKSLTKEVLRDKPENIYEYAAVHFEKELCERDGSLDKDYELFNGYMASLEGQQQFIVPASLGFKCQRPQRGSGSRRSKPDILSSFKVMESIHEEDAPAENLYSDERYQKAVYVIQRYYRRYMAKKNMLAPAGKQTLTEATAAVIIQRTMRKLFASKFPAKRVGDSIRRGEAAQEDADNVSEAASYTSSSTIQLLAESQEGRENRSTTEREEIADDIEVAESDGSTTVADEPPTSENPAAMEGEPEVSTPTPTKSVNRKSMAHENDESDQLPNDEASVNPPTAKVSDDTSTAPIGILSTKIGSNDQQNSLQTNTVDVAKDCSSNPTQVQTAQDVTPVESNQAQPLGSAPEPLQLTPPSRKSSEKTFAVRLQSNAYADNNAGYTIQSAAANRKLPSGSGESLKMYSVFYQDGDDPDFSDSLNESTMERDSLETVDLDADSLESSENAPHVGAIVKRETVQAQDALCSVDTGGDGENEGSQNAQGAELERVPSYIYGIHPTRTPILERKNLKHRTTAEGDSLPNTNEKSEEDSMESKESTSEESSATQIENILEAGRQEPRCKDGADADKKPYKHGLERNSNDRQEEAEVDLNANEEKNGKHSQEPQILLKKDSVEETQMCTQSPEVTEVRLSSGNQISGDNAIGQTNEETTKPVSATKHEGDTSKPEIEATNKEHIPASPSGVSSTSDGSLHGYFEALYNMKESTSSPSARQDYEVESQLSDLRSLCNLYPGLEIKDIISEFHTKHVQPEPRRKNSVYDDNNNVEDFETSSPEVALVNEVEGTETELIRKDSGIGGKIPETMTETLSVDDKALHSNSSEEELVPHEDVDLVTNGGTAGGSKDSPEAPRICEVIYPDASMNDFVLPQTSEINRKDTKEDCSKQVKKEINQEKLDAIGEVSADGSQNKIPTDRQSANATNDELDGKDINRQDLTQSLLLHAASSDVRDDNENQGTNTNTFDVISEEVSKVKALVLEAQKEDYNEIENSHDELNARPNGDPSASSETDQGIVGHEDTQAGSAENKESKHAESDNRVANIIQGGDREIANELKILTETELHNAFNTDEIKETSDRLDKHVEDKIANNSVQIKNLFADKEINVDLLDVEQSTVDDLPKIDNSLDKEVPNLKNENEDVGSIGKINVDTSIETKKVVMDGLRITDGTDQKEKLQECEKTSEVEERDVGSTGKFESDTFVESAENLNVKPTRTDQKEKLEECEKASEIKERDVGSTANFESDTFVESAENLKVSSTRTEQKETLEECEKASEIKERDVGSTANFERDTFVESAENLNVKPTRTDQKEKLEECEKSTEIKERDVGSTANFESDTFVESAENLNVNAPQSDGLEDDKKIYTSDEHSKLCEIDPGQLETHKDVLSEGKTDNDTYFKTVDKHEAPQDKQNEPLVKSSESVHFQENNHNITIDSVHSNDREPRLDELEAQIIETEDSLCNTPSKEKDHTSLQQSEEECTAQKNDNIIEVESVSVGLEEIVKVNSKHEEIDEMKKEELTVVQSSEEKEYLENKSVSGLQQLKIAAHATADSNTNCIEDIPKQQTLKTNKATNNSDSGEKLENNVLLDKKKETQMDEMNEDSLMKNIEKTESEPNSNERRGDSENLKECDNKQSHSQNIEQESRLDTAGKNSYDAESGNNNKCLEMAPSDGIEDNDINLTQKEVPNREQEDVSEIIVKLREIEKDDQESQETLLSSVDAGEMSPGIDKWMESNLEMASSIGQDVKTIEEKIVFDHSKNITVDSESKTSGQERKDSSHLDMDNVTSLQLKSSSADKETERSTEHVLNLKEETESKENLTKPLTNYGSQANQDETGLKGVLKSFKADTESSGKEEKEVTSSAHDTHKSSLEIALEGSVPRNLEKTEIQKKSEVTLAGEEIENFKKGTNEECKEKLIICDAFKNDTNSNEKAQTEIEIIGRGLLSDKGDENGLEEALRSYKADVEKFNKRKDLEISLSQDKSQKETEETEPQRDIKEFKPSSNEIREDTEKLTIVQEIPSNRDDNGLKAALISFKGRTNETQESIGETGMKSILCDEDSADKFDKSEKSVDETGLTEVLKCFKDEKHTCDLEAGKDETNETLSASFAEAKESGEETGLTNVLKSFKNPTRSGENDEIPKETANLTDFVETGLSDAQKSFKEDSHKMQNEVSKCTEEPRTAEKTEDNQKNEVDLTDKENANEVHKDFKSKEGSSICENAVELAFSNESTSMKLDQENRHVDENSDDLSETSFPTGNAKMDERADKSKQGENEFLETASTDKESFKDIGEGLDNDLDKDLQSFSTEFQHEDSERRKQSESEVDIQKESNLIFASSKLQVIEQPIEGTSDELERNKDSEQEIKAESIETNLDYQPVETTRIDRTECFEIECKDKNDETDSQSENNKRIKRSLSSKNFSDVPSSDNSQKAAVEVMSTTEDELLRQNKLHRGSDEGADISVTHAQFVNIVVSQLEDSPKDFERQLQSGKQELVGDLHKESALDDRETFGQEVCEEIDTECDTEQAPCTDKLDSDAKDNKFTKNGDLLEEAKNETARNLNEKESNFTENVNIKENDGGALQNEENLLPEETNEHKLVDVVLTPSAVKELGTKETSIHDNDQEREEHAKVEDVEQTVVKEEINENLEQNANIANAESTVGEAERVSEIKEKENNTVLDSKKAVIEIGAVSATPLKDGNLDDNGKDCAVEIDETVTVANLLLNQKENILDELRNSLSDISKAEIKTDVNPMPDENRQNTQQTLFIKETEVPDLDTRLDSTSQQQGDENMPDVKATHATIDDFRSHVKDKHLSEKCEHSEQVEEVGEHSTMPQEEAKKIDGHDLSNDKDENVSEANKQDENPKNIAKDSASAIDDKESSQEEVDPTYRVKVETHTIPEKDEINDQQQKTELTSQNVSKVKVENQNNVLYTESQREIDKDGEMKLDDAKEKNHNGITERLIENSLHSEALSERCLEKVDKGQSEADKDAELQLQDIEIKNQNIEEAVNKLVRSENEAESNQTPHDREILHVTETATDENLIRPTHIRQTSVANLIQPQDDQDKSANETDFTRPTEVTGVDENTAETSADFSSIGKDLEFFEDTITYLKDATSQLVTGIGDMFDKNSERKSSNTEEMLNKAAIIIQSVVRGYRVRKEFKKKLTAEGQQSQVSKYVAEGSSSIPIAVIHPTQHTHETQSVLDGVHKRNGSSSQCNESISATPRSEIPRLKRERPLDRRIKTEESPLKQREGKTPSAKTKNLEDTRRAKPRLSREKPIERHQKALENSSLDDTMRESRPPRTQEKAKKSNPRIVSSSNIPERHRLDKSKRDQFAKKGKSLSTNAQTQKPLVFDLEAIKKDLLSKKPVPHPGKERTQKTRTVTKRDLLKERLAATTVDAQLVDQSKSRHSNAAARKETVKKDASIRKSAAGPSDFEKSSSPRKPISKELTSTEKLVQEAVKELEVEGSESSNQVPESGEKSTALPSELDSDNKDSKSLERESIKEHIDGNVVECSTAVGRTLVKCLTEVQNADRIDGDPCDLIKKGMSLSEGIEETINEKSNEVGGSLKENENAGQTKLHHESINNQTKEKEPVQEILRQSLNEQCQDIHLDPNSECDQIAKSVTESRDSKLNYEIPSDQVKDDNQSSLNEQNDTKGKVDEESTHPTDLSVEKALIERTKDNEVSSEESSQLNISEHCQNDQDPISIRTATNLNQVLKSGNPNQMSSELEGKTTNEEISSDKQSAVECEDLNQSEGSIESEAITVLKEQVSNPFCDSGIQSETVAQTHEETCDKEHVELNTVAMSNNIVPDVQTGASKEENDKALDVKAEQPDEDEFNKNERKHSIDGNDVFENTSGKCTTNKDSESEHINESVTESEHNARGTEIKENDKNVTVATSQQEPDETTIKDKPLDNTNQVDLNPPAVLIQKTFRGYNTRKTLNKGNVRANQEVTESHNNQRMNVALVGSPLLDESATVIQKNFRGYKARKELKENSKGNAEGDGDNCLPSPAEDPESQKLDNSAVTIQKTFRGYRTRKELEENKRKSLREIQGENVSNDEGNEEGEKILASEDHVPEMNEIIIDQREKAATMIQKTYKGYRTRRDLFGERKRSKQNIEQLFNETVPCHSSSAQQKSTSAHALLESAAESIQKAYRAYNDRKEGHLTAVPVKSYSHGAEREHVCKEVVENSDESSIFIGPDTSFDLSDVESVETKSEQVSDTSTFVATDDKPEDVISKTPTPGPTSSPEKLDLDSSPQPHCSNLSLESEIRRKRSIIEPTAPALEDILKSDESSSVDCKLQWYVGDDPIIPTDSNNTPSTPQQPPVDTSSSSRFENSCSTDARLEISNKQPTPSIQSAVVSTSSLLFSNDSEMHDTDILKQFTKPSRAVSAGEEEARATEDEEKEKEIKESADERMLKEDSARDRSGCCHKGEKECSKALSADPFSVVIKVEDLGGLPIDDVQEIEAEVCKSCAGGMHEAGLSVASPRRKSIEEINRAIDGDGTNVGNDKKDNTAADSVEENDDEIKKFVLMEDANEASITDATYDQCINNNNNNCNKSRNDSDLADVNGSNKINTRNDTTGSHVAGIQSEGGDQEKRQEDEVDEGHESEADQRECPAITLISPSSDDDVSDKYDALFVEHKKKGNGNEINESEECKDEGPILEAEASGGQLLECGKKSDEEEVSKTIEVDQKVNTSNEDNIEENFEKKFQDHNLTTVIQAEGSNETQDEGALNEELEGGHADLKNVIVTESAKEIQNTAEALKMSEGNHLEEKLEVKIIDPIAQAQVSMTPKQADADATEPSALELPPNTESQSAESTKSNNGDDLKNPLSEALTAEVPPEIQKSESNIGNVEKKTSTKTEIFNNENNTINEIEIGEQGLTSDEKLSTENSEKPSTEILKANEAEGDFSAGSGATNAYDAREAHNSEVKDNKLNNTNSTTSPNELSEASAVQADVAAKGDATVAHDARTAENALAVDNVPEANDAQAAVAATDDETEGKDQREQNDEKAIVDEAPADNAQSAAVLSVASDSPVEGAPTLANDAPATDIASGNTVTDKNSGKEEIHTIPSTDILNSFNMADKSIEAANKDGSEIDTAKETASKDTPEYKHDPAKVVILKSADNENTTSNPDIEAKLDRLIDSTAPIIDKESLCVEPENLPTENSLQEVVEEPCIKKIVSPTPLSNASEKEDSEIESTTTKADSTTTSAAYDEASENEVLDNPPSLNDTLEKATEALRESEAVVARMHLRRDSEQRASIEHVETMPVFGDIASEPIKPMQELQKPTSPETDDDIVLQNLQRGDTTRESSAQSESVVFGNSSSQFSESEDVFNENFHIKTMHRMNTVAVDHGTYKIPHMLFKSVTIDDAVKYIDPEKSTEESGDSFCLDDALTADVRKKMMAYSISEADSDYFEPAERSAPQRDDFNISTALDKFTSSDTDTTIVSAATKIQAGARGFLTRRRLRRASMGTRASLTDGTKASFGNDAIGESLDRLVEEEANKRLPKTHYQRQVGVNSLPSALGNSEETEVAHSPTPTQDELSALTASTELLASPSTKTKRGDPLHGHGMPTSLDYDVNAGIGASMDESSQALSSNLEATLAARRLTLQRGDAMRNDSTPDDDNSSGSGKQVDQAKIAPANTGAILIHESTLLESTSTTTTSNGGTERKGYSDAATITKMEKIKWFAMRQNSMPVQIDSEVFRVLPKHMRKRIKSAEGQQKRRIRLPRD